MDNENELTCLTKAEEEKLMKSLYDFVLRTADSNNTDRLDIEIAIMPEVAKLIVQSFVRPYY